MLKKSKPLVKDTRLDKNGIRGAARLMIRLMAFTLLTEVCMSNICFSKNNNKLPKVLVKTGPDPDNEIYQSIVGNDDFVIYGGHGDESDL